MQGWTDNGKLYYVCEDNLQYCIIILCPLGVPFYTIYITAAIQGGYVMIVKAEEQQLDIVREITQQTIDEIYPHYYPIGAVEFFKAHHNDENILVDIQKGIVFLLKDADCYVGTVTIRKNEICRLFVLPEFQHKGFGKQLIDFAEEDISKNYSDVILDASMSAKKIYKMRGYTEIEYNQIETKNGDVLCYDVMKKECELPIYDSKEKI